MADLQQTVIRGDFRAEDVLVDLNDSIGGGNDPDTFTPLNDPAGIRIKRGAETGAVLAWDEANDQWEAGLEGSQERILTESDISSLAGQFAEGENISLDQNPSTGQTEISAIPSGSDTQIQFNSAGFFGASPDLTFDDSTDRLTSAGGVDMDNESTVRIGGADVLYANFDDASNDNFGFAIGDSAEQQVRGSGTANNIVIRQSDSNASYGLAGARNTILGDNTPTALGTDNNTFIGYGAGEGAGVSSGPGQNTFLGATAGRNAGNVNHATFVGEGAGRVFNAGSSASSPHNVVAIGSDALRAVDVTDLIAIGREAGFSDGDYTQAQVSGGIALGGGSFTTAAGQFAVGAPADKSYSVQITDIFLGRGPEATDPQEVTVHATDADIITNTKNATAEGGSISIAAGRGSGNSTEISNVRVLAPRRASSNYQQQSLFERFSADGRGLTFGSKAETNVLGQLAFSDSTFGQNGDSQASDFVVQADTADVETQTLVAGEFSGPSAEVPEVPVSTTWGFEIQVVATAQYVVSSITSAEVGDAHVWNIEGAVAERAGNLELIGEVAVESVTYDVPLNDLSIDVQISGQQLQIQATGKDGTDLRWTARVKLTEVGIV